MADEPFYAPDHKPTPTPPPKPGERIWTLLKAGRRIDYELHFRGESWGWECQCLDEGELAYARRFALKAGALEEAEAQRKRLVGEGWRLKVG
jgi:hypothetical protein